MYTNMCKKLLGVDKLKSMYKKGEVHGVKNVECLNTADIFVFKCSNVSNATSFYFTKMFQRHV